MEGLLIIIWVFLAVVAILWFFLPFAVFGIKDKLDASNRKQDAILAELMALRAGIVPEKPKVTPDTVL